MAEMLPVQKKKEEDEVAILELEEFLSHGIQMDNEGAAKKKIPAFRVKKQILPDVVEEEDAAKPKQSTTAAVAAASDDANLTQKQKQAEEEEEVKKAAATKPTFVADKNSSLSVKQQKKLFYQNKILSTAEDMVLKNKVAKPSNREKAKREKARQEALAERNLELAKQKAKLEAENRQRMNEAAATQQQQNENAADDDDGDEMELPNKNDEEEDGESMALPDEEEKDVKAQEEPAFEKKEPSPKLTIAEKKKAKQLQEMNDRVAAAVAAKRKKSMLLERLKNAKTTVCAERKSRRAILQEEGYDKLREAKKAQMANFKSIENDRKTQKDDPMAIVRRLGITDPDTLAALEQKKRDGTLNDYLDMFRAQMKNKMK